jgi:hypothetical protein
MATVVANFCEEIVQARKSNLAPLARNLVPRRHRTLSQHLLQRVPQARIKASTKANS